MPVCAAVRTKADPPRTSDLLHQPSKLGPAEASGSKCFGSSFSNPLRQLSSTRPTTKTPRQQSRHPRHPLPASPHFDRDWRELASGSRHRRSDKVTEKVPVAETECQDRQDNTPHQAAHHGLKAGCAVSHRFTPKLDDGPPGTADTETRSLYRRSLKLALDWSVHRELWRGQAIYIRSLFENNRDVSDPRLQRVRNTFSTGWRNRKLG